MSAGYQVSVYIGTSGHAYPFGLTDVDMPWPFPIIIGPAEKFINFGDAERVFVSKTYDSFVICNL